MPEQKTVDLKELRYFQTIAECGTFSKAAAHLLIDSMLDGQLDVAIVDAPSHPHADLTCAPLWIETLELSAQPATGWWSATPSRCQI